MRASLDDPAADRELVLRRRTEAPRATVWRAWTDPEHPPRHPPHLPPEPATARAAGAVRSSPRRAVVPRLVGINAALPSRWHGARWIRDALGGSR